jgi:hypothetical protein
MLLLQKLTVMPKKKNPRKPVVSLRPVERISQPSNRIEKV